MSSNSQNKSLGTKYHNQTTTTVLEAKSNSSHEQPRKQLIHTTESSLSNQGIDVSVPPGVINARFVQNLMTPSGIKPVILLTDELIDLNTRYDYLPGCALPEQGHVWSTKFDSASAGGNVSLSAPVQFSRRTEYYMKPFQYFNSHAIVRLICKPALTQSQSFWVSRSTDKLDFSNGRFPNEIGFNWVPSKTNEIFVLLPWFNQDYVVPHKESLAEVFGYLNVRNLTELVSATGNEAPLEIAYYFSPLNMYTYNPLPVHRDSLPSIVGALVIAPARQDISSILLGHLKVTGRTWVSLRSLSGKPVTPEKDESVSIYVSNLQVGRLGHVAADHRTNMSSTCVQLETGTHSVMARATESTFRTDSQVELAWYGGTPPTFKPVKQSLLSSPADPLPKEIEGIADDSIVHGEEQIFEYQYNPKSEVPAHTYGKMFDHNPREDHHDMFLKAISISSTNKYTPFNFTLDLSLVAATYPYVVTREYLRHYFKSHMPILTIRSNKSPFSNLLCRIVQGTYTNYDDIMQLPGSEWDPTITDNDLQPYWTAQTPGVTDLKIPFTIIILSGQIDLAGMQLVLFFNTSTLEYHHKIDYEFKSTEVSEPEVTAALAGLGMCQMCATAPCQCRARKPPKSSAPPADIPYGVEQGSETTVERVENESIETRSPDTLEGVSMETSRLPVSPETGKTQIEKDYHFVGAVSVPLTTTLKFVQIPISHNSFGKMEVSTAKKYKFWSGEPTFRITTAASSTLTGIMYVAQVPPGFNLTNSKAFDAIRMFPRTNKVFWNESCELPIKWMNPSPLQKVDYESVATNTQLGSLILAFPTTTGSTFTGGDQNLKVTISCNTSNIVYSRPSYSYKDFSYPGMQHTIT
jgi:hypothetical protein